MSKPYRKHAKWSTHLLVFSTAHVLGVFGWAQSRLTRDYPVPIEVLISGVWRRWILQWHLHYAVRRLQRVLPSPLLVDAAIIVQTIIMTERQIAGCFQIGTRSDGSRFALIRLALQVNGRAMTSDEILAVLAEQYISLAMQNSGPSLLVPVDLAPLRSNDPRRPTALRRDPLAPHHDFDEPNA